MFNTSVCVNPGESVLGKGLASWAKFGRAVTKVGIKGNEECRIRNDTRGNPRIMRQLHNIELAQFLCNGDVRMRKCLKYDIRKDTNSFGVWYLHPSKWTTTERACTSDSSSLEVRDQMFEEVCDLPSTKGFISFCKEKINQEPKFLKMTKKNHRKVQWLDWHIFQFPILCQVVNKYIAWKVYKSRVSGYQALHNTPSYWSNWQAEGIWVFASVCMVYCNNNIQENGWQKQWLWQVWGK